MFDERRDLFTKCMSVEKLAGFAENEEDVINCRLNKEWSYIIFAEI
jgi:hypothetical protein